MSSPGQPASWLCRDDVDRERVIDMERRIKPTRTLTFALIAAALVFAGPWEGWWTLIPLALATVLFAVADRLTERIAKPEYAIAAAWITTQTLTATSIALTGGIHSPALGWLAIPVVTLGARFDVRGLAAGMVLTVVLLLASTIAVDPQAVLDRPDQLVDALVLVAAVALLSSALMESDREHRSESVLDGLTGMLNRRSLASRVAELTEQSQIAGAAIGLIVGDIDNFKAVNDEHGHSVGDAVLVDVAYALRKELRAFDMAYRLGGEEFLVLLPGAERRTTRPSSPSACGSAVGAFPAGGVDVTMSFGVASSPGGAFDYQAAVRRRRRGALRGQARRAQPRDHGRRAPDAVAGRLAQRGGQRAAGGAPAEDAAAEERALQRAVAVHAAAAEAGDLAGGVQAGQRLAGVGQDAALQVGLQAAERLAREDVQLDGDQRAGVGVEQAVGRGDAGDAVGEVGARAADRGDLHVLGVRVVHLAVAGDDLALDRARRRATARR